MLLQIDSEIDLLQTTKYSYEPYKLPLKGNMGQTGPRLAFNLKTGIKHYLKKSNT
jgi:hypothetical protein